MQRAARFIGFLTLAATVAAMGACRGGGDDDGDDDDDVPGIDAGPNDDGSTPTGTTVKDVQDPAKNMPKGTPVTLEGVIVTAIDTYGTRVGSIYVQDLD